MKVEAEPPALSRKHARQSLAGEPDQNSVVLSEDTWVDYVSSKTPTVEDVVQKIVDALITMPIVLAQLCGDYHERTMNLDAVKHGLNTLSSMNCDRSIQKTESPQEKYS